MRPLVDIATMPLAIAYLASIEPVGTLLLEPLESRYSQLDPRRSLAAVGTIVVVGGDYAPRPDIPVSAALNDDSLKRIVEAAPVGQYARTTEHIGWRSFLPTSRGLSNSERALHEYIGLAALAMGFQ